MPPRHPGAGQGRAEQSKAPRLRNGGRAFVYSPCMIVISYAHVARPGVVWRGAARRGAARRGEARRGTASGGPIISLLLPPNV